LSEYQSHRFYRQVMLDGKQFKQMLNCDLNREFKVKVNLQSTTSTNCSFFIRRFLNLLGKGYVAYFDYHLVKIVTGRYNAFKLWGLQILDSIQGTNISFIYGVGSPECAKEENKEEPISILLVDNIDEDGMQCLYKNFN